MTNQSVLFDIKCVVGKSTQKPHLKTEEYWESDEHCVNFDGKDSEVFPDLNSLDWTWFGPCSRLAGPREGRDRHRPPPSPEPHQHLQRGWPAEALEALRRRWWPEIGRSHAAAALLALETALPFLFLSSLETSLSLRSQWAHASLGNCSPNEGFKVQLPQSHHLLYSYGIYERVRAAVTFSGWIWFRKETLQNVTRLWGASIFVHF